MSAKVQTKERQQRPCPKDSVGASNNESVSDAKMRWALAKTRSGPSQFSEKMKDYLIKKFDLGERTGEKADVQQVAMGMLELLTTKGFFVEMVGSQKRKSEVSFSASHLQEESRVTAVITRAKMIPTRVKTMKSDARMLKR